MVQFRKDSQPRVVSSEYGDSVGGADVDRAFLQLLSDVADFQGMKLDDSTLQAAQCKALLQFQEQKTKHFSGDAEARLQPFQIGFGQLQLNAQKVQKKIQQMKLNADEDDPDIALDENALVFTHEFALERLLKGTLLKLAETAQKLLQDS